MSKNIDEWNLNALFKNIKEVDTFATKLSKKAQSFEKKYNGRIAQISDINSVVKEYEEICEGIARIATFVFLLFAKDTKNGAIYAKYELVINEIQKYIIFFEVEFAQLDSKLAKKFIAQTSQYSYFLSKIFATKNHTLSKEQEKIILALSPVGANAFSRLFDEFMSKLSFKLDSETLTEEEILSKLHSKDRITRKKAQKELTRKLKKSTLILSYILNIIKKDTAITAKLRNYPKAESFRHIDNQISQKSVDSMIKIVESNFAIPQEYYAIKSCILGIKKLKDYDRYAPLNVSEKSEIPYSEAKKIVIESYSDFSPKFGKIVANAFKDGWVDSAPCNSKRGGAFSHGATPKAHPYILLNYTNSRRDIFTIAHEFGHAIHQELSKNVGYLNMDTPLTTAETASVFGEMLLFDKMKQNLKGDELLSLYAGKLEDIFSTLFRQVVMTNFELKIHAQSDELSVESLNDIWLNENAKMFGSSLKLTKNYAFWWSYIPHFIHSPFYCYAYSYGQLLSLALFGLYKQNAKNFIDKYTAFLSAGGSQSPKDLVAIFGFDIESEAFWEIGIKEIKKLLGEFKALAKEQ